MERNVDGYHFSCDEDAKMAQEELKKINLISQKLNANNPQATLLVYNKCIQSNQFTTPIGIDYLKSLQSYLLKSEAINSEDILDIPIRISYADALELKSNNRYKDLDKKDTRDFRVQFSFSLFFNIVLIIMVIAMFVIALKADNPNIINYKNAIVNEYSAWEQDLTERENIIREKESELNLN